MINRVEVKSRSKLKLTRQGFGIIGVGILFRRHVRVTISTSSGSSNPATSLPFDPVLDTRFLDERPVN